MNATLKLPKQTAPKTAARSDKKPAPTSGQQDLIAGLNQDLAGEYQAIVMYIHYSAKLTGPFRRELRALFQAEIADEQKHAQFLSDKIAALGGDAGTQARRVPPAEHPREMLDFALSAEVEAVANYATRIGQAQTCGELGLKVELENLLADETRHKEEIERILAGWDERNLERTRDEARWQDDGGQG